MIPKTGTALESDFTITEQPTLTYRMSLDDNLIRGHADDLEAMLQAIYKILSTERYQYTMYTWNYGIELMDLYGEPISYVCPEMERRITEALLWDDRIEGVTDFVFDTTVKGAVHVTFTVHTVFGDTPAERTVNI